MEEEGGMKDPVEFLTPRGKRKVKRPKPTKFLFFSCLGQPLTPPDKGGASWAIHATSDVVIPPGGQVIIDTGIHTALPSGHLGLIRERHQISLRKCHVHATVIDQYFRGELRLIASNYGTSDVTLETGEKIAFLVVIPFYNGKCERVESRKALGVGRYTSTEGEVDLERL